MSISDLDGEEANRFYATTSGQTVLYDSAGKIVIQRRHHRGRGHEGDNAGETAIEDLVNSATFRLSADAGLRMSDYDYPASPESITLK